MLDGATIRDFIEDKDTNRSINDRFTSFDTNHDGRLSYTKIAKELKSLRVLETHFGVDEVKMTSNELVKNL